MWAVLISPFRQLILVIGMIVGQGLCVFEQRGVSCVGLFLSWILGSRMGFFLCTAAELRELWERRSVEQEGVEALLHAVAADDIEAIQVRRRDGSAYVFTSC